MSTNGILYAKIKYFCEESSSFQEKPAIADYRILDANLTQLLRLLSKINFQRIKVKLALSFFSDFRLYHRKFDFQ
ncbi:MAG: hypothetical protein RLY43_2294 [Bacteroidota bacterium]